MQVATRVEDLLDPDVVWVSFVVEGVALSWVPDVDRVVEELGEELCKEEVSVRREE